jgi:hypothetical protein
MPISSSPILRRVIPLASILLIAAVSVRAAQAAKPGAAGSAKATKTTTNAAPTVAEPPKSVFHVPTSMQDPLKDPFFPQSTRLRKVVPVATPTSPAAPVVNVKLELKGISGTSNQRLAIINSHTYGIGEEADLGTGNDHTRIRVVDIKNDSVVVEVNGERQVLRLRSGL